MSVKKHDSLGFTHNTTWFCLPLSLYVDSVGLVVSLPQEENSVRPHNEWSGSISGSRRSCGHFKSQTVSIQYWMHPGLSPWAEGDRKGLAWPALLSASSQLPGLGRYLMLSLFLWPRSWVSQRLFLQPAPSFRSLEGHGPSCLWAFAHINSSVWIIPASFHLINWDSSWLKVHFLLLDPPSRSFSKKCVPWPWIVYLMCVLSCSALSYSLWPHGR